MNQQISSTQSGQKIGKLALEWCQKRYPLRVLRSNAGFYIGTAGDEGPCSRESAEYFATPEAAEFALSNGQWTQRDHP